MEILPGVHVIPGFRWSKAYLIVDETITLVDSGLPWNGGGVRRYVESIGRDMGELGHILLTHGHPDHTGAARGLSLSAGAKIMAHESDTMAISDGRRALSYRSAFGPKRSPNPFGAPAVATTLVEDGDTVPIHGGIRVVHTPGHTPGSVCFSLERSGVLFTGDTIFSDGKRLSRSIPFPGYDRDSYVKSLERIAAMEFDVVCGGHGEPLMGGGSAALRRLLESRPDPPTWRAFFKSLPGRLGKSGPITGEHL